MTAKALTTGGKVVTLVAAYETARGLEFADAAGRRYPERTLISYWLRDPA